MAISIGGTYGGFSGEISLGGGGGVSSGSGGGSPGAGGACPGQKTSEIGWLMSVISDADRRAWMNDGAAGLVGAGGIPVADKIAKNDAAGVAFDAAGGADCKVTSDLGKQFTSYTLSLLNRYEAAMNLPPTPTVVTQPTTGSGTTISGGVSVTTPGGGTVTVGTSPSQAAATLPILSNPLLLAAAALAIFVLVVK